MRFGEVNVDAAPFGEVAWRAISRPCSYDAIHGGSFIGAQSATFCFRARRVGSCFMCFVVVCYALANAGAGIGKGVRADAIVDYSAGGAAGVGIDSRAPW